jgi:type IV secretory pathway VirB10-like protein
MSANDNFSARIRASQADDSPPGANTSETGEPTTVAQPAPGIESLNRRRGISPIAYAAILAVIGGVALVLLTPKALEIIGSMRPKAPGSSETSQQAGATQSKVAKPELDDGLEVEPKGVVKPTKEIELIPTGTGTSKTEQPQASERLEIGAQSQVQHTPTVDIRLSGESFISTSRKNQGSDSASVTPQPLPSQSIQRNGRSDAELVFGIEDEGARNTPATNQASNRGNGQSEKTPDTLQSRISQVGGKFPTVAASRTPNRSKTILAGRSIPCTLDDAVNSSLPGQVNCTIQRPVLSEDASCTLINAGSRAVGEYVGRQEQGQERIFFVWREVQTNNHIISTQSIATDSLGRSGIDGSYDSRFFERFRGALLLSIVNGASSRNSGNSGNVLTPAVQAAADSAVQIDLNIPPVTRLEQGRMMLIRVAQNWTFDTNCIAP